MTEALLAATAFLAVALVALLVYAATRPDTFSIERSIVIGAPAARVFPLINDLRALNTWNPFNADPSIKGAYDGPASGVGAAYTFASPRAGTGRIEVIDAAQPTRVDLRLVMTKPFACDNRIEYRLVPNGATTIVTWAMSGRSSLASKLMCAFMNPDRMVGGMFEKGLADLKRLAERQTVS
ncbi:MAG: SRPBCC family protein [Hyphomicrobiaceae bacterium]|nr:SRPBCC family protein [Hyphomicrobiaceae bacterium]